MRGLRSLTTLLPLAALVACQGLSPGVPPITDTTVLRAPPAVASESSQSLHRYYSQVQADLLARGLLRTDGGGPDTPYTPDMLARNFENVAFYDEYARGAGLRKSNGHAGQLRRWSGPVRINVEYGTSVSADKRTADTATVQSYVARLAATTAHPISYTPDRANFHVLVMGQDDRNQLDKRVRQIIPGAQTSTLNLFRDVPRSIHCLVVAFSADSNDHDYKTAIALVRAEHPDLMRKACYHEEIAQGLGLANDSPEARPSIFNDDDEFALLTSHDEALLAILYDPRLSIGMPLEQARPVIHILAREQAGRIY